MAIRRISDLPQIANIDNINEEEMNRLLESVIEISEKMDEDENVSSYDSKYATIGQLTSIILDKVVNRDITFSGEKTFGDKTVLSGGAKVDSGLEVNGDVMMVSNKVTMQSQDTSLGVKANVQQTIETDDNSVVNVKFLNDELKKLRTAIDNLSKNQVGMSFDQAYPVGSVYISLERSDACPIQTGTWQKVEGRYLLCSGNLDGTTETHNAGDSVEAGAPQMSVSFTVWGGGHDDGGSTFAFGNSTSQTHTVTGRAATGGIYGKSKTLRPPAIVVDVWKRIG